MQDKLSQLLAFLQEDPRDPFTLFALALEYDKRQDPLAWTYYEKLLEEHPDYEATYYHAGKWQESWGQRTKAMEIFHKGIELTQRKGMSKAMQELKNAYQLLEFED